MKVEFCFSGAVLPVMKKIRRFCFISVLIVFIFPAFAEISFNGLAGAVGTLCSDPEKDNFDLQLKLQTFFAGQFNLSDNLMVRGEFTVKTSDLIEKSVFKEIDTKFQIDELSLTFRSSGFELTNYLSLFIGTYEPIGSDIFLRRYFGINPIASRLTESWLGTAGSVIYPLIGAGLGDVLHFSSQPIAIGFYAYVNHELNDSYVFNIDARIGMVYRYMKLDFSTGIGAPLNTKYYNDAFIVVNKLYWRAGINLLLGNPRNFSMYVQTGASEIPFSKNNKKISFSNVKTYILNRAKAEHFRTELCARGLQPSFGNRVFPAFHRRHAGNRTEHLHRRFSHKQSDFRVRREHIFFVPRKKTHGPEGFSFVLSEQFQHRNCAVYFNKSAERKPESYGESERHGHSKRKMVQGTWNLAGLQDAVLGSKRKS